MPLHAQCPPDLTVIGPGSQTWQAPATGGPWSVRITAIGGGGGNINAFPPAEGGGGGATMIGTFTIQNSQTIRAIAGGGGGTEDQVGGGGGGGSGAVNCGNPNNCATGTILIIAAGGNGEGFDDGTPGSALTNGNGSGGPGCGTDCGGGGGGINSNGVSGTGLGSGTGGGQVFKTGLSAGGTGGPPSEGGSNVGGDGMGGGGGGGSNGPGGGGGHTGGQAGDSGAAAKSFNSGSNQNNSNGAANTGPLPGSVVISCLGSLPVELINFKALIQGNGNVQLLWSTATEKNNIGYDVERSADNHNWATLGFVPGNGTSTRQNDYHFTDEAPFGGVNYYRLKQMDTDGKTEYSPMVVADVRADGLQLGIFPNPSTEGEISVRTVSKSEGNAELEIYDWAGYKVYKETVYLLEGTMVYPVSLSTFPKGTYTVRLEMPDGQVHFQKVVLQ